MVTRLAHVHALERDTVLGLGVRALWLHLKLTGIETHALSPRDRELLTIVATRPHGVPLQALLGRLSATAALTSAAGRHWIQRLVAQGLLSTYEGADDVIVDLAEADLRWIAGQVDQLTD